MQFFNPVVVLLGVLVCVKLANLYLGYLYLLDISETGSLTEFL